MQTNLIITDDFYQNPDEVRAFALAQPFEVSGNYPGFRTKPWLPDDLKESMQWIIQHAGGKITHWFEDSGYTGAFQICTAKDRTWIHADSFNTWAAVCYLTPDAPLSSGTALYRYKGVADFKQQIGLTYKNATPRSSNTTDSNYWTGIMGWTATDWNSMSDWGCGFVDSWDSPANRPPVGTHHVGIQSIHYTNGTARYGWQMAAGGGNNRWWLRDSWGSSFSTWFEILTSTNYTSFSPSLTGTGASGTWGISITGNAGTATSATSATSATTATNGFTSKPGWAGNTNLIQSLPNFNNSVPSGFYEYNSATNSPSATWYNLINVRHSNTGNDHGFQLAMSYYDNNLWFRSYQGGTGANNGTFQSWAKTLSDQNYTDYTVTKTGTGASGTWGINIMDIIKNPLISKRV